MQKKRSIKRCGDVAGRGWIHSLQTPVFSAVGVRVRTCSAVIVKVSSFLPFLPPVLCAVHYMQLEECRRGAAKRERVLMSAHGEREGGGGGERREEEKKGFFSVISRSGTVSCTLVRGSSHRGATARDQSLPYYLDIFQKTLNYTSIPLLPCAEVPEWFTFN